MVERLLLTPDTCIACKRCEAACIAAHHNLTMKEAMKMRDIFAPRVHVIKTDDLKTTVRCHQCNPAPCVNICPTKALHQEEDGRIVMHEEQCVACKMCISACPYGAISIETLAKTTPEDGDENLPAMNNQPRQVAVRCDVCRSWRMKNGKKITACMEACPKQALYLMQPDGSIVKAPPPEKKAAKQAS